MIAIYKEVVFWFVLLAAAVCEVIGVAMIGHGERIRGLTLIIPGFIILGSYGLVINVLSGPTWLQRHINLNLFELLGLRVTFSMMLGVYVVVFATVSVVGDHLFGSRQVPLSTWLGLSMIVVGGLIIRYGGVIK